MWAQVTVGVGFTPIEALSASDAVQRVMAKWPELGKLIDNHAPASEQVNDIQSDCDPLEFMVDVEGDDQHEQTTHWALDPDNGHPYILLPCETCGAIAAPEQAASCNCGREDEDEDEL